MEEILHYQTLCTVSVDSTWQVTASVWHSWVFPVRNSPNISVMEPVSIPPAGQMSCQMSLWLTPWDTGRPSLRWIIGLHPARRPPVCGPRTVIPSLCVLVGSARVYRDLSPCQRYTDSWVTHCYERNFSQSFTFIFGAADIMLAVGA